MIRFNKFIKNSISGVLISSLIFGNVGYSFENNNKNNFIKEFRKKDNSYIFNSNDKKALKKIFIFGSPVAFLTCWWLCSGSNNNETNIQSNQNQNQTSHTNPTSINTEHQYASNTDTNKKTDINIIINQSKQCFETENIDNPALTKCITDIYEIQHHNLGQIIAKYCFLARSQRDKTSKELFENRTMSKWFIGAVKEHFINVHNNRKKDSDQENIKLIENELIALYNESNALIVVETARKMVAKIISTMIDKGNPLLTEGLIEYQLKKQITFEFIIPDCFPGNERYVQKWNNILKDLKNIDFIKFWNNNIGTYTTAQFRELFKCIVEDSDIDEIKKAIHVRTYGHEGINYKDILEKLESCRDHSHYTALYNLASMIDEDSNEDNYITNIRNGLIKIVENKIHFELSQKGVYFNVLKEFCNVDEYLNSVAKEIVIVKD